MFVQKFSKKQNNVDSNVYMSMDNIGADIGENGDTAVRINDHINSVNRANEQAIDDKLSVKSSKTNDSNVQQVTLPMNSVNSEVISARKKDHRLVESSVSEQNTRIIGPIKDGQEHFEPIMGYAQEPLLPLVEACIPLANIIRDLSTYIHLAISKTPREPPDELTFDESAAIRLYTLEWEEPHESLYSMLNSTLKKSDRQALRPYFKYLKLLLTGLVKLPCAPLQTVWRGVNKDFSKSFPPGTPVTWWAFSSCTTSLTVLENSIYLANFGERTLFSVEAINGRIIRDHSHFDYEDEIILLPGTYMEVHSQLSPAPDLHIIHLKQIKPMKTLLELPFEDAPLYPRQKEKVPWYKTKRTVGELILLIILCLAGIIVGLVLGTRGFPPPSICYTRSTGIDADLFWSFDCGDAREDLKRINNGTAENGANYSSPDFSGQGKALYLNQKLNQYVRLPYSLNLGVNTSFTVSVWIFSTGYNLATILTDCSILNSVCVKFFIYSVNIYAVTFNRNNENIVYEVVYEAWKVNYQSCWIRLTFKFDNRSNTLSIYFNGYPMATGYFLPNAFATNQTNGSETYIGSDLASTNRNTFDGLIDQLSISYHVKNDSEILAEATLLCQYNFDSDDVNMDSGPNFIQAYSQNVSRSLSNNQSSLLFNLTDSFFQSSGFTFLMSDYYAFSIAFWLRPIMLQTNQSKTAMAILQLASQVQSISSESYVCFLSIYIVNSTGGQPYIQFSYGELNMYTPLNWYTVQNNTWIHVGVSYASGSQITFYINGINNGYITDTRFSLLLYNPRLAVTMGGSYFDDTVIAKPTNYESRKCFAEDPQFNYIQMYGEIDNLNVFARALSDSEFAVLASTKNITSQ